MLQVEAFKVDIHDEDLEDDDMDLYYKLKNIDDQMLVMKVRQALQSAIINRTALKGIDFVNKDLLKQVATKREIQEAKINLIKMLSECETEEELQQVLKLKNKFMDFYC